MNRYIASKLLRPRLKSVPRASVAAIVPILQASTYAHTLELLDRMRAQSLATKDGKAAPLPTIDEAREILRRAGEA